MQDIQGRYVPKRISETRQKLRVLLLEDDWRCCKTVCLPCYICSIERPAEVVNEPWTSWLIVKAREMAKECASMCRYIRCDMI
jgi:hypothetical protein